MILAAAHFLICIATSGCNHLVDQHCSIVIGDAQLPVGQAGNFVLITPEGSRRIDHIDKALADMMHQQIQDGAVLDDEIDAWNAYCSDDNDYIS